MESDQSFGLPASGAEASGKPGEICQLPASPITSEEANDSSFEEGDSGGDSGLHTGSNPASDDSDLIDRGVATSEIMSILDSYPEISIELLDWSREFIEEHPELLSAQSTIVQAYPDREKSHAEFHRGVNAITRVVTDRRLEALHGWATTLEQEWLEAVAKGDVEVRYGDYIDLMYSEAGEIVEKGEGAHREDSDVQVVGEVFGFAPTESQDREEERAEEIDEEGADGMKG